MKRLAILVTTALALVGSAAAATPTLRAEVTVIHGVVTVGDMFDNAGALAEKALFLAPAPGTTGTVSLDAVRQAATLAGIADYTSDGVLRVRVARAATLVDEALLTTLITDDLVSRGIVGQGIVVEARFETPGLSFNAEAVADPVQLASLRYMPGNGVFAARFMIAGTDAPVDVNGRIELMIEAPHLVANRMAGTVLAPADIEMRLIPLKFAESSGVVGIEQLVGKQLVRQSRAGLLLRATDVTDPSVVERNAMVTVVFNSGPMVLSVRGQALNTASIGQPVQVLNTVSKKILHGVALSDGTVGIGTTIAVAGL